MSVYKTTIPVLYDPETDELDIIAKDFWRSGKGAEVDSILQTIHRYFSFEVKRSITAAKEKIDFDSCICTIWASPMANSGSAAKSAKARLRKSVNLICTSFVQVFSRQCTCWCLHS